MIARFLAVLTPVGALVACAHNPIVSTNTSPGGSPAILRVEASLTDGSRIVGTPVQTAVDIRTPYADFAVELHHIDLITALDGEPEFGLELVNGDRVSGRLAMESFDLTASFGRVSLRTDEIREILVRRQTAALPDRLRQHLALHYSFDKDAGEVVQDQSRNRHDGRVQDTTWVRAGGSRTGCLAFNGRSSIVNVGCPPGLSITQDLTISAWFSKPSRPHANSLQTIVAKDDKPEGRGRSYMLYVLDRPEGSRVVFSYGLADPSKGIRHDFETAELPLADEEWHHVAVVHKTGEGNRMLVDGSLVAQDEEGSPLPLNPQTDVLIGDTRSWESWYFLGQMDDIMVFRAALSDAEVAEVYQTQR